jgi:hypothetical protein
MKLSQSLDQEAAGALLGFGQLSYSGLVGHEDFSGYQLNDTSIIFDLHSGFSKSVYLSY